VAKGNGSGHIVRCLSLARSLGQGAAVFVPAAKSETSWSAAELSIAYARELSGVELVSSLRADARAGGPEVELGWDFVVLDRRATSLEELAFWERFGPVLAIDEGGAARESAHYLIDILPSAAPRFLRPGDRRAGDRPNKASLGFLDLPQSRRDPPASFERVLASFGGEDPAGLSLSLARTLVAEGIVAPSDLTIVTGALRRGAAPAGLDGVTVLGPVQDLKEHLSRYDLVFTQFGLTAFEAAWAGCGVILLNPTPYHRALSRAVGFPEIGVRQPDLAALRRLLRSPAELLSRTAALAPEETESLADFIAALAPAGPTVCPACGSAVPRAMYRDEDRSFFRCSSCGMIYLARFSAGRENPYKESYFFDEYRRQYGVTYLEDWPKLQAFAHGRLDELETLARASLGTASGLSVLDVGCAYGPFLAAARARGHDPFGLDAAPEAADYVRRELGIPAVSGDFLDSAVASAFGGPFDLLTMWYVVEHFDDLDRALRNAAALLRPGGVLALSTPSGEGASARFGRRGFFARSPADHFTVWEPSRVRGILKAYGFRVEKIRITGHHPERLPLIRGFVRRGGLLGALGAALGILFSRLVGLGDTFEVYALRETAGEGPEAVSAWSLPSRRGKGAASEAGGGSGSLPKRT
jgi:2-polyprenyl-3-methyl-5-hydroxy-6-metoxy-1,4-benzoquinol methylase